MGGYLDLFDHGITENRIAFKAFVMFFGSIFKAHSQNMYEAHHPAHSVDRVKRVVRWLARIGAVG